MKVNRFTFSYTGNIDASWIKVAQKICDQMRIEKLPRDPNARAIAIEGEVLRVAKRLGINMQYWPESLSIEAE